MKSEKKTWGISRFFSFLFTPVKILPFIVLNAFIVTNSVFIGLKAVLWGLLIIPCIDVIVFMIFAYTIPKSFGQENGVLSFEEDVYLRYYFSRNGRFVKVKYTVFEVKDVVFSQNFIEKKFNVGRVSFSGPSLLEAGKHEERIKKKNHFVIRGIKNFSKFKTEFEYKI